MGDLAGPILFMLALFFGVPIFLAKVVLRASWRVVGMAYAVWFGLLALWGLSILGSGTPDEAVGWTIIMGMFLTIPAIFVITLVLRIARVK